MQHFCKFEDRCALRYDQELNKQLLCLRCFVSLYTTTNNLLVILVAFESICKADTYISPPINKIPIGSMLETARKDGSKVTSFCFLIGSYYDARVGYYSVSLHIVFVKNVCTPTNTFEKCSIRNRTHVLLTN